MSQDKSCLVGALGLHEHETRLVKSILRQTILRQGNGADKGRYEWTEDLDEAHLVMVYADNVAAMKEWQALAQNQSSPVLLLVIPRVLDNVDDYYMLRPFAPSKILILLDRIFNEKLKSFFEPKIFSGKVTTPQRDTIRVVQGVASTASRVLVVDDSPTVRKQLEIELGSLSIRVDSAESGEQGLAMLEKDHYDIIFLDVVMPGVDGYEVCRRIRKNMLTKQTPVIMLTSKSSSFDRVRGAMAGCNSYLTKPVDYEKFHKVLEEYLTQD